MIGGMSMSAVTAYLRQLRIAKKISQGDWAGVMGLSLRQTNRWETRKEESIKADALMRAAHFLGASLQHIQTLLLDDGAGEEEGRRLAEEHIQTLIQIHGRDQVGAASRHLNEMSDEELLSLMSEASTTLLDRRQRNIGQ